MEIKSIDKAIYRKRLTSVIVGFIVIFAVLAITFGSTLIIMFSEQWVNLSQLANEENSNFKYNLLGVALALLACGAILHGLRNHDYFNEIYYVWQIKQLHNQIYRKLKRIKSAAFDDHNKNAIIILDYYYATLKQIYMLDDNTLTLSKVKQEYNQLTELIERLALTIDKRDFDKAMINTL